MHLIVQLFLLDNITIHFGSLLEQRNPSSLGKCRRGEGKYEIIRSQIYKNRTAVSHPRHTVWCQLFTWLPQHIHAFLPEVTGADCLCLKKNILLIFHMHCICDWVSEAVGWADGRGEGKGRDHWDNFVLTSTSQPLLNVLIKKIIILVRIIILFGIKRSSITYTINITITLFLL